MPNSPQPQSVLFVPRFLVGVLICTLGCTAITDFDRMGRDGEVADAGSDVGDGDSPDSPPDARMGDSSIPDMRTMDAPDGSTPDAMTGLCASDNGGCAQVCSEVEEVIVCSCNAGYSLGADTMSCVDIDECTMGTNDCRSAQRCFNTVGSFLCETFVANEPFSYPAGSVDGQNGGTGWSGPWLRTFGSGSTLHVVTPGLEHAGIATTGGRLIHDGTGSAVHQAERRVRPSQTGVTYVQFLGAFASPGVGGTPTLRFYAGAEITGAVGNNNDGARWALLDDALDVAAGSTSTRLLSDAAPVLVLVRIDYGMNETSLYIDPDLDAFDYAAPPAADASMDVAPVFDRISISFREGSAIDEIQVQNFGGEAPVTQRLEYRGRIGRAHRDKPRGGLTFHDASSSAYVARWEGAVLRYRVLADGGLDSPTSTAGGGSQWAAAVFGDDLFLSGYYRYAGPGLRRYAVGGTGQLVQDGGYNPLSMTTDPRGARGLQQIFRLGSRLFVVAGYTNAFRGDYSGIALPDSAVYEIGGAGGFDHLNFEEIGTAATCTFNYDPDCYSSLPRIKVVGDDAFYSYPEPGATRDSPRRIRVGRWNPPDHDSILLPDDGGNTAPIATCDGLLAVTTQEGFALVDMMTLTPLSSTPALIRGSRQGIAFSPDCASLGQPRVRQRGDLRRAKRCASTFRTDIVPVSWFWSGTARLASSCNPACRSHEPWQHGLCHANRWHRTHTLRDLVSLGIATEQRVSVTPEGSGRLVAR